MEKDENNEMKKLSQEQTAKVLKGLFPDGFVEYEEHDANGDLFQSVYVGRSPFLNEATNIIEVCIPSLNGAMSVRVLDILDGCNERDLFGFYTGAMAFILPELHTDDDRLEYHKGSDVLEFCLI